jgi:hypothetical protein
MSYAFQAVIEHLVEQAKTEHLADKGIITLGEIIDKLSTESPSSPVKVQWGGVLTDFGDLMSYRGYYSDLAIDAGDSERTVDQVLSALRSANGKTFYGYKGGDFTMGRGTLVWVSSYGECTGVGVTGVEFIDGVVVITSADCESY